MIESLERSDVWEREMTIVPQVNYRFAATTGENGMPQMMSGSMNLNVNVTMYAAPITSTNQILTAASKLDLAAMGGQPLSPIPRVPGIGKDKVIDVAPDFDDTLELGR